MKPTLRKIPTLFFWILLLVGFACCPSQAAAKTDPNEMPLPVRVLLLKIGPMINAKKYDQAISELKAFQERGKSVKDADKLASKGYRHPEVCFALGNCYLLKEAYKPAAKAYEEAVKNDPTHVSAWLNLAKASFELNDYERAACCFANAYEREEKKAAEHLYYSAVAYQMASKTGPCLKAFKTLFEQHGAEIEPAWRENYVHALLAAEKPRQALPHIQKLAEQYTGEKQVQWQEILLHQYLSLDIQDQAREYALFLTRQAPTHAKWWKALAHVDLHTNRYDRALVAMTVYSFLTPLSVQETKLLADLNLQLGIPLKAAPLYEKVLVDKKDTRLVQNLALALQRLGQTDKALEALNRFAPTGKLKNSELAMLRADLLYGLKRFEEAGKAYRQAAAVNAKKAGRAWLMAGYAAMQIEDMDASRKAFEKAATFRRHRKAARLALQQMPGAEPQTGDTRSRI